MRSSLLLGSLLTGTLAIFACGGFGSNDDNGSSSGSSGSNPDGGDGSPFIDGAAASGITLTPAAVTIVQGKAAELVVQVAREGTPQAIDLVVAGLPPGVTAVPARVEANATTATISLSADATAKQGKAPPPTLNGTSAGATTSVPFDLSIRGAPGTVDTTFGVNGVASLKGIVDPDVVSLRAVSVVQTPNGNIYALYQMALASQTMVAVGSLLPDGSVNTGFANAGYVVYDNQTYAYGLAVQPTSGRLLVAINLASAGSYLGEIGAYSQTTGKADETFGSSGAVSVLFGAAVNEIWSMSVSSTDAFLIGGRANTIAFVARYTAQGALDGTFNTVDGHLLNTQRAGAATGTILLADGTSYTNVDNYGGGPTSARLFGLTVTGAAKPGFGDGAGTTAGSAPIAGGVASAAGFQPSAIFPLPASAPTTVVSAICGLDANIKVQKLNPASGAIDTTYKPVLPQTSGPCQFAGGEPTSDGKIIVGSFGTNGASLLRLNADGSIDTTFAQPAGLPAAALTGMHFTQQADGKILVLATPATGSATAPAVIRLWN